MICRSEAADIVICVHNAPETVTRCLEAVVRNTPHPYRLVIVDDGSETETALLLRNFAQRTGAKLIRHGVSRGYTASANAGIRETTAPWIVLLNSDAVPTDGWLEQMWLQGVSDSRVGMVGPLSNCAAWQSAPRLTAGGDWASSKVPPGLSPEDIGRIVANFGHAATEIPFLNGFCYMIRRAVIEEIGLFDEARFPRGYGEEHDFSIRAAQAGWKAVVAGNAYVFHEGSKSFGHSERKVLVEQGEAALRARHDPTRWLEPQVDLCRNNLALAGMRARLAAAIERRRLIQVGQTRWRGRRLAFVVNREGGAARTALQEARALHDMDVDVSVCVTDDMFAECRLPIRRFSDASGINTHLRAERYDAVISADFHPSGRLPERSDLSGAVVAYYMHNLTPGFFWEANGFSADFRDYAERGDFVLLTRVPTLAQTIEVFTGRSAQILPPSIDFENFYPRGEAFRPGGRSGPATLAAMIRPSSPWRESTQLIAVVRRLKMRLGHNIDITIFGAHPEDLKGDDLLIPSVRYSGLLRPDGVAALLNQSDLFLDLSSSGAMSLLALEAMACGCAVVMCCFGGAATYANHLHSAFIVDGNDLGDVDATLDRALSNHGRREEIQRNAVTHAFQYTPEAAATALMEALFAAV